MCCREDVILPEIGEKTQGQNRRKKLERQREIIIKRADERGRLMISKPSIC